MVIRVKDYLKENILITTKIAPEPKEEVAYDLHVGPSYKRPGDENPIPMPRSITLLPNDCVRIDTEEEIRTPVGVFGQSCSRTSLTWEGLVASNLKIDPNFQGRLEIAVFNTSKRGIHLRRGDSFCSIFFFTLQNSLEPGSPIRVPPHSRVFARNKYKEFLIRVAPFVATFGFSVAASLAANYIFHFARLR